jgi:hypothetical protein
MGDQNKIVYKSIKRKRKTENGIDCGNVDLYIIF